MNWVNVAYRKPPDYEVIKVWVQKDDSTLAKIKNVVYVSPFDKMDSMFVKLPECTVVTGVIKWKVPERK